MTTNGLTCIRCGLVLSKLGRRDVHFGPILRHDPGRVNKISTDALVCPQCGHLEFFLLRIGAEARANNPVFDINNTNVTSPPEEEEPAIG